MGSVFQIAVVTPESRADKSKTVNLCREVVIYFVGYTRQKVPVVKEDKAGK